MTYIYAELFDEFISNNLIEVINSSHLFMLKRIKQPHIIIFSLFFRNARYLARHMLELSLQNYTLSQVRPSLLSLVALCEADKMLGQNSRFVVSSAFNVTAMKSCKDNFQSIVDGIMENTGDFEYIFEKYSHAYGENEHVI